MKMKKKTEPILSKICKKVGLIIGTGGIIIGFWDKTVAIYSILLGIWCYLVLGSEDL